MALIFALFFILIAIFIEIAGFIFVGSRIGIMPTLALLLAAMLAGIILLRAQGAGLMARIRQELENGRMPDKQLVEGIMMLLASVLLIIPGFVSDIFGILLFIPPLRSFLWHHLAKHVTNQATFYSTTAKNKKNATKTPFIELEENEYHVHSNENSPWRHPDDKK